MVALFLENSNTLSAKSFKDKRTTKDYLSIILDIIIMGSSTKFQVSILILILKRKFMKTNKFP